MKAPKHRRPSQGDRLMTTLAFSRNSEAPPAATSGAQNFVQDGLRQRKVCAYVFFSQHQINPI